MYKVYVKYMWKPNKRIRFPCKERVLLLFMGVQPFGYTQNKTQSKAYLEVNHAHIRKQNPNRGLGRRLWPGQLKLELLLTKNWKDEKRKYRKLHMVESTPKCSQYCLICNCYGTAYVISFDSSHFMVWQFGRGQFQRSRNVTAFWNH